MLEIGSLLDGKYKILNKVGQGGMSVVYLAMNEKANKQWAVKEVRKDGVLNFEAVKQGLVAETDILKRLKHPNLPSIIDVIDTDESFIIIMDYVEGNSLKSTLDEFGAQPQENVIDWAKQLCDVLGYLHTRTPPIIYRDMKPANIMLKPDGKVTLIDFGTAREYKEKNLADTTCLGTVGYAAPEQYANAGMGQTDARTDIYCLGATLYHLVTGKNPSEPPYEIKPIREINPNLSTGLERIIKKCTQRDPKDRYQSAAELMYALDHYKELDDIYHKKQKRKLTGFLAALVMTFVFAGVSIWGYSSREAQRTANYDNIISEAANLPDDSAAINKYYEAMVTDPTRVEVYLGSSDYEGLIGRLLRDDKLTREENACFTQIRIGVPTKNSGDYNTNVDVMGPLERENPEGYQEVCREIGEAILYYYDIDVEKDKYESAAKWFQYAQDQYPYAKMICDISRCMSDISKYNHSEQLAKEAEAFFNLWEQINALSEEAKNYEDIDRLHLWTEVVKMIENNASNISKVAEMDDVMRVLQDIRTGCQAFTNPFAKDEFVKKDGFEQKIESVLLVIQDAYNTTG